MSEAENLSETQALLDRADHAYYQLGAPLMTDAQYDALRARLARLSPTDPRLDQVGSAVRESILTDRAHGIPMGSQSKATSREEYDAWLANNLCKPLARSRAALQLSATLKADGGSISLEYRGGRLVAAITRGDGVTGEDITANAALFQRVPRVCLLNGTAFDGYVRGETVLSIANWQAIAEDNEDDEESNPRNTAVGIYRRKSGEQSDQLEVYALRAFDADGVPLGQTETEQRALLTSMGFSVLPSLDGTPDEIWAWFYDVETRIRGTLPYWIDGVVVSVNDLGDQLALGETHHRPKGQVALKFAAEEAETVLRALDLSVGHSGVIVPTGIFDPVALGGTTVTRATLNNFDYILGLRIAVGDRCTIKKAGEIIPQVVDVLERGTTRTPILTPTACPSCGGAVAKRLTISGKPGIPLYCLNEDCPARQAGRIDKYMKSVDILGAGAEVLKCLVDDLKIGDAADLYTLRTRRNALAGIQMSGKVRFGESRADRFLDEIDKRRTLSLPVFLGSIGVIGLGKRAVANVQAAAPGEFDRLEDWLSDKLLRLAEQVHLPNAAENIHRQLQARKPLIEKFLANGVQLAGPVPTKAKAPGGLVICITGALSKPKSHYQALIEAAGHTFTDTYSAKTVTQLVAKDPAGSSSKLEKARKAGTPILDEAGLLALLGQE
jgi:DNA ligase (NAD+)